MSAVVLKALRELRLLLAGMALLLAAFQVFWAMITERVAGQLVPFFSMLAGAGGLSIRDVEKELFHGPAEAIRALIGGEGIDLQNAQDMLSISYVHPLMVSALCIWAVGRAAGAIAGEIDRGTMELLLAQPIARSRLVGAQLIVDVLTIPALCLCLWGGTALGCSLISPIEVPAPKAQPRKPGYLIELGPLKVRVDNPLERAGTTRPGATTSERLEVHPDPFGRALWQVGGLLFAVTGLTLWLSAAGRSRWRVLGIAVFAFLVQFLVNLVGQLWGPMGPLRPLTIFYYYQPQQAILGGISSATFKEWNGGQPLFQLPTVIVLFGVGLIGYLMALWTFRRRDIPAPL